MANNTTVGTYLSVMVLTMESEWPKKETNTEAAPLNVLNNPSTSVAEFTNVSNSKEINHEEAILGKYHFPFSILRNMQVVIYPEIINNKYNINTNMYTIMIRINLALKKMKLICNILIEKIQIFSIVRHIDLFFISKIIIMYTFSYFCIYTIYNIKLRFFYYLEPQQDVK